MVIRLFSVLHNLITVKFLVFFKMHAGEIDYFQLVALLIG